MTDLDAFLSSSGAPAFKFENVGDTVKGRIVAAETREAIACGTGEVDRWPNGNPKEQLVVTLEDDSGDQYRIFAVKPSAMFVAIADAVKKVGQGFREGGTLAVKFSGTKPSEKYGTPQKLYAAKYEPPTAVADPFDADTEDF